MFLNIGTINFGLESMEICLEFTLKIKQNIFKEKWIGHDMETCFYHVVITDFLIHNTDYVDKLLLSHVNSNHMQIKRKKTQTPCLLSTCIAWMPFYLMSRIMRKPAF